MSRQPGVSKDGSKLLTNEGGGATNKLNGSTGRYRTQDAQDVRATHARPWVEEASAIKQLIRMVLMEKRGKRTMVPVTIQAVKGLKKLLGIEALETKEREIYWRFPDELRMNLERVGIDPETGVCVDEAKFGIGLRGIEQEEANRLAEKFEGQDYEARKAAFREVLQKYRPTRAPAVASVGHYLENQVMNTRIARELREAGTKD